MFSTTIPIATQCTKNITFLNKKFSSNQCNRLFIRSLKYLQLVLLHFTKNLFAKNRAYVL